MDESAEPIVNTLNAPFWEGAKAGRLVLPHCVVTTRAFWPPAPVSPFVTGGGIAWREASAEGVLCALVTYERVFQAAFRALAPYRIGLVALDAGVRLQAHLSGASGGPEIGERVVIGFANLAGGKLPVPVIGPRLGWRRGCL